MRFFMKALSLMLIASLTMSLSACSVSAADSSQKDTGTELLSDYKQDSQGLAFDNSRWNYDKVNNVYWQIGVGYCTDPETADYETLGIYVPGEYMTAKANSDGTYACTLNKSIKVNGYTADTAPIVFPVNTAGYSAQASPTAYSYDSVSAYLKSGFIYVYSGMRGRSNGYDESGKLTYSGGAPWGVTDLKAAVRYYRFNQSILPGDTDRIFTFGHSGGGAQSSVMGSTGDSPLYYTYLKSIGAAMFDKTGAYISDAICGAMCWCPITSLDYADEAYEWNMGQYAATGSRADTTWTAALSDDLAEAYATYINGLGLTDEKGTPLTLEKSSDGIYTAGTYYNYVLSVIEGSLNNFLSDTTFPYTKSAGGFKADGGFGNGTPPDGGMPTGTPPSGGVTLEGGMPNGMAPGQDAGEPTTYKTVQDYITSLNAEGKWIQYDAAANTAKITSVKDFVTHCKTASKSVAAFDATSRNQAENDVFGNDESDSLHFDAVLAGLLQKNQSAYAAYTDWDASLVKAYANDLNAVDKFGTSSSVRQNMYNPMFYVSDAYAGYGTSKVAPYWRIHTGINQGDTATTVEANLALELKQNPNVKGVDFETVWGQGHTTAERTGDSTDNFIKWVNTCVNQK